MEDKTDLNTKESILTWEGVDLKIMINKDGSYFGKKDQEQHILKNLHGYAKSGECLAIMGSSGAGKSTLLNVLANWLGLDENMTLKGQVMLNQEIFSWKNFKNVTGFVMQRDLFDENLKVKEVLKFAIDMLGQGKSNEEKLKILQNLIWDLKLTKS